MGCSECESRARRRVLVTGWVFLAAFVTAGAVAYVMGVRGAHQAAS